MELEWKMLDFRCSFLMHTTPVLVTVSAGTWTLSCVTWPLAAIKQSSVLCARLCFGPELSPSSVSQQGGLEAGTG